MNLILSPADSLCNVDVDYNSKLHLPTSLQHDPTGFVRVGLVLQIWHIRGHSLCYYSGYISTTKTCIDIIRSPADSLLNVDVENALKLHVPTSLKNVPTGFVRVGLVLPDGAY